MPEAGPDQKNPRRNPKILLVLVVMAASIAVVLAILPDRPAVVSTPLSSPTVNESPQVGPLLLSDDARLEIHSSGLHAEFAPSGEGMIIRADPGGLPVERIVTLDSAQFRTLLADLGRVKAAWGARQVGEAAAGTPGRPAETAESSPATEVAGPTTDRADAILIREKLSDGSTRSSMRLAPEDPEYEDARAAITPLVLVQD
jgi:hypothetical protein